jgi:Common central domain of tyrosinase
LSLKYSSFFLSFCNKNNSETALQEVTGNCDLTVPYWDWERDAGQEQSVDLFDGDKFGRFECGGGAGWGQPCTERTMGRDGGGAGGRSFATETELLTMITRDSSFGDFAFALEGRPHSVVHAFIGGLMSNRRSPTDPLFWLHHSNVDRIWTLHQDYWNHDVDMASGNYLNIHYSGAQNSQLPFLSNTRADYSWNGDGDNEFPTAREVLDNTQMRVRYLDDNLAGLLERTDDYEANGQLFEPGDNSGGGCRRRHQRDRKMFSGGLRGWSDEGIEWHHQMPLENNVDGFDSDALNLGPSLSEDGVSETNTTNELPSFCQPPTPSFTLEKDRQRWNDYCQLLADPDARIETNITSAVDLFAVLAELDCEDIAKESGEPDFDMNFLNLMKSRGWVSTTMGMATDEAERDAYACPRPHRV